MVYRLYKVDSKTGKSTGKKRDYPSEEHFLKYGLETYERYNREYYFTNKPTETKAKLCFLNENNKWEEVSEEQLKNLLTK
jgi:hypothetical protein